MLFIFGGLPGTGKSTLAAALARRRNAVYLRIDTIEQAVRDSGLSGEGPVGYMVGYKLASENLRLDSSVVVDSVNPISLTRLAWRDVAAQAKVSFVEIEILCSNLKEHRNRIESRQSDIPGHKPPTWNEVVERQYEQWDTDHIVIDTAGYSTEESIAHLFSAVDNWRIKP